LGRALETRLQEGSIGEYDLGCRTITTFQIQKLSSMLFDLFKSLLFHMPWPKSFPQISFPDNHMTGEAFRPGAYRNEENEGGGI